MLEVSKVWNTVLYYEQRIKRLCISKVSNTVVWTKDQRLCQTCQKWCLWLLCNTVYRVMVLRLEVSKEHYTLYTEPLAPPRGKVTAFCLVGLVVQHSEETALLTFWELSNYKGSCRQNAWHTINSWKLIALSNPVFLTHLWEQSCISYSLTKADSLHTVQIRSKSAVQFLRMAACEVVLALIGSVFDIIGSYEQRDLLIWQN